MSGGSYNYLFTKDPEELVSRRDDLEAMRNRLVELGATDVAAAVEEIAATITSYRHEVEWRMAKVADVLQAVEWLDSNDWGEDQMREAIAKYRATEGGTPDASR